jgi:hypothetical protein
MSSFVLRKGQVAIVPTTTTTVPSATPTTSSDLATKTYVDVAVSTISLTVGPTGPRGVEGPIGPGGIDGATGPEGNHGDDGATGPQGESGPQGLVGETGPQGPVGGTGPQGESGPQGLVGATGSQGLVGGTGPQGASGLQGASGSQGDAGATGAQGTAGLQGVTGATGIQGIAGPTGSQGLVGETGPQGASGLQGASGSQGDAGATGAQGAAGLQGDTGATGIQGVSGVSGLQGAVGATGSQGDAGATGPQGASGLQGVVGETGSQGATGIQGVIGVTGAQGVPGVAGPQGIIGETGATGATGLQGNDGATGVQGVKGETGASGLQGSPGGATGPQGLVGETGATGPQGLTGNDGATGLQGVKGETGASGLQGPGGGATGPQGIAGDTGATGPQGIAGATGPQGIAGPTGAQGVAGATGAQGPSGASGPQGLVGEAGPQGVTGVAGATGPQGAIGATGLLGPTGIAGPTGPQGPTNGTVIVTSDNSGDTCYPVFSKGVGTSISLYADNASSPMTYIPSTGRLSIQSLISNQYFITPQAPASGSTIDFSLGTLIVDTSDSGVTFQLPIMTSASNGFVFTVQKTSSKSHIIILNSGAGNGIASFALNVPSSTYTVSSTLYHQSFRFYSPNWYPIAIGSPEPLPPAPVPEPVILSGPQDWRPLRQAIINPGTFSTLNDESAMSADGTTFAWSGKYSGLDRVAVYKYSSSSNAWARLGNEIVPDTLDSQFGSSIALSADGTVCAIGAPTRETVGLGSVGSVSIYKYNSGTRDWIKLGTTIVGTGIGGQVGTSVALSSDGLTCGFGGHYDTKYGKAYVYKYNGTSWVQRGSAIVGETYDGVAGKRVALSSDGTIFAVNSVQGGTSSAGQIYIYKYNGTDWVKLGSTIQGAPSEYLGEKISLSSDGTLLVASLRTETVTGRHGVRVFKYNSSTSSWNLQGQQILIPSGTAQEVTGATISSDGSIIAFSSIRQAIDNVKYDEVYSYIYNTDTGFWDYLGNIITVTPGSNSNIVRSLSLSSSGTIVASANPSTKTVRFYTYTTV